MIDPTEFKTRKYHYVFRSKSLWERRRELQQTFPEPEGLAFADFIDSEAIIYQTELQEVGLAFPEWESMVNVGGETDLRVFLKTGLGCFRQIRCHLPPDLAGFRILDFGVGCGRTARFFFREADDIILHGCDVDKKSVEYVQTKFPIMEAVSNSNNPPLPYDSSYFDYIYCVSLFTHFNRLSFQNWLIELSRCLVAGGLALLTLHGRTAFEAFISQDKAERLNVTVGDWQQFKANLATEAFTWAPQKVQSADVDSDTFGISFVDEDKLERLLPSDLKVVGYFPGAIGGWQDLALVRKV
jgi:SAM-dependent methyltransferase